jgi:hypothetical protein
LGSESETCVGSRVHLVGVSISFEKNFYRLPFTPPSLVRRIGRSSVKERSFNVGDLVLCRIQNTEGLHKLSSPWEGPFTVTKVTGPGSYRLQTLEGEDVNNSWNID